MFAVAEMICMVFIIILQVDVGVFDYKVVGSASDGFGFYASQGSNKHIFEDKSALTQDVDLNIFLNSVAIEPRHAAAIPYSTGFTWIKFSCSEVIYKQH